jgi:hypothetical protein
MHAFCRKLRCFASKVEEVCFCFNQQLFIKINSSKRWNLSAQGVQSVILKIAKELIEDSFTLFSEFA